MGIKSTDREKGYAMNVLLYQKNRQIPSFFVFYFITHEIGVREAYVLDFLPMNILSSITLNISDSKHLDLPCVAFGKQGHVQKTI